MIYVVQYLRIHKKIALAVKEGEAWLCEQVSSSFVMGVFQPRIILPCGLGKEERCHIIQHEKMHLQHRDTLVRLLGVACTVLHWWNPLVWLSVHTMSQDMEMFCDEAVLWGATAAEKKAYARTLVAFAAKQSGFSFGLAFGESKTEQRVKNIIEEKHCSRIVIAVVALLMIVCMAVFLTVPDAEVSSGANKGEKLQAGDSSLEQEPGTEEKENAYQNFSEGTGEDAVEASGQNSKEGQEAVEEKEQVHMFSRSDVLLVDPVQEYGFDFMKILGEAAGMKKTAGEVFSYQKLTEENIQQVFIKRE